MAKVQYESKDDGEVAYLERVQKGQLPGSGASILGAAPSGTMKVTSSFTSCPVLLRPVRT